MEQLNRNLEAAEDALNTFRANARLSKISDPEAEQKLLDSINHARLQIQKWKEDKAAFFEDYKTKTHILEKRQEQEREAFHKEWADKAKQNGWY